MEIERKWLLDKLPEWCESYPHHRIMQAYLNRNPDIRIRTMDNKSFLTVKGVGDMVREEYEIPIYRQAFMSLIASMNGSMIVKNRYVIPPYDEHGCEHTIEIDVFHGKLAPLVLAEIEFKDEETAKKFVAPSWFGKEVTYDKAYKNSQLSLR